jgi:Leucine-rich repeat (LRR) protein
MMESQDLLRLIDRRAAEDRWKELDLAGMNLTELPAEIVKLSQLEKLILGKWDENTGDLQAILSFYFQLDIY